MEPLNTQQEVSLASDDQNDSVKEDEIAAGNLDDSSLEGRTGTYKDSSSSPESDETPSESRVGDDSEGLTSSVQDVQYTSNGTDAIKNASIQEDLQHESTFDNKSISPEMGSLSLSLLESENVGDSFVASGFKDVDNSSVGTAELSSELTENPVNVKPTTFLGSDGNPSELNTDHQYEMHGSGGHQNSDLSFNSSSSTIAHIVNEPVALNVDVNSQSNATLENQYLPKNDIETVNLPSSQDNLDLRKAPQVSAEKNSSSLEVHNYSDSGSSGISLSASAYTFVNEKDADHHNQMNRSRSELQNPGNSFSAGIPAPSVVSAALQELPGKVLVPAVVDQVQGQALAALQVLKVLLCPHLVSFYYLMYFEMKEPGGLDLSI